MRTNCDVSSSARERVSREGCGREHELEWDLLPWIEGKYGRVWDVAKRTRPNEHNAEREESLASKRSFTTAVSGWWTDKAPGRPPSLWTARPLGRWVWLWAWAPANKGSGCPTRAGDLPAARATACAVATGAEVEQAKEQEQRQRQRRRQEQRRRRRRRRRQRQHQCGNATAAGLTRDVLAALATRLLMGQRASMPVRAAPAVLVRPPLPPPPLPPHRRRRHHAATGARRAVRRAVPATRCGANMP